MPSVHRISLVTAASSSWSFTAPDSLATRNILSTKKNGIICYIDLNKYSHAYSLSLSLLFSSSGFMLALDVSSDIFCVYVHSSAGVILRFLSLTTMFSLAVSWMSARISSMLPWVFCLLLLAMILYTRHMMKTITSIN